MKTNHGPKDSPLQNRGHEAPPLDKLQGPQVVEMHYAENLFGFVDDDYRGNFALFHLVERFACKNMGTNGLRVAVAIPFTFPALRRGGFQLMQIAVGENPARRLRGRRRWSCRLALTIG
jgi:hypothetical protein